MNWNKKCYNRVKTNNHNNINRKLYNNKIKNKKFYYNLIQIIN